MLSSYRRVALIGAVTALVAATTVSVADGHSVRSRTLTASAAAFDAAADPFTVGRRPPAFVKGPCTDRSAAEQYPTGAGHDHLAIAAHGRECLMEQRSFLALLEQTENPATPQRDPNEVLGEMDLKNDVAAVAVAYPRAGVLFFDVSNPASPQFTARYRGAECEGAAIDVDCGAFVDLSSDAKTAFLSVQQISVVPGGPPGLNEPVATPGVDVVDVETGRLTGRLPVQSIGGVHTSRSHVIPPGPSSASQPRAPGEYLFSVANGLGIQVSRVVPAPTGGKTLQNVGRIDIDEVHDMFLQDDPLTGRTYMYVAAGFDTGFYVYDVTDPSAALGGRNETLLAEWDLTPECEEDWYAHTIDVAVRNGRRYVTMPAELFTSGEQSEEDRGQGCGKTLGNGDKAGPMWIVDATDFNALGRTTFADSEDGAAEELTTDARLKAASQNTLVTTWTNAAGREGQNLNFSPHNQQIVGNSIFLSGYHSGVTVLDASAAFAGRNERPRETAFLVPAGRPERPIYEPTIGPTAIPFFTTFINFRPLVWDMVAAKGHVFAADMTGGFYSLRQLDEQGRPLTPDPAPVSSQAERACPASAGLRSVDVQPRRRGAVLGFRRLQTHPVSIDVFQQSAGRRVIGERRVARFPARSASVAWDGTANIRGRRVTDGYYLVRYTMPLAGGRSDVRRVALRRSRGRFSVRPSSYRRASCGLLSAFKLERPVFGGRGNRSLFISYRLSAAARVTVTITRGRRVVRRFTARQAAANKTHRLRFPAEGRGRGDYRVTIVVDRGGRRVVARLAARRI